METETRKWENAHKQKIKKGCGKERRQKESFFFCLSEFSKHLPHNSNNKKKSYTLVDASNVPLQSL